MWLFRPTLHCQHAILRASSLPPVCSCPYPCLCLCVVWFVPWERHALMCSDFNNLSVGKFKQGSTCGHLLGGALVGRHSGICLTSGLRSLRFQVMCLRSFFFFRSISLYFSKLNNIFFCFWKSCLTLSGSYCFFFFSITSQFILFLHMATIHIPTPPLSSAVPSPSCKLSVQLNNRH